MVSELKRDSNHQLIERQRNVCGLRLRSLNYCARWTGLALEIINSYYQQN